MKKGEAHSEATKRLMSESKKLSPEERLQKDHDALRLIGPAKTWEFAERIGCSEKSAVYRLRYLYDAGLASRSRERGATAYTYEVKT